MPLKVKQHILKILSVGSERLIFDFFKCLCKNLRYGIFVYSDLASKLVMLLFVISKDFNLLMRSTKFLMYTELIVPRKRSKIFAMSFANLQCVLFIRDTIGYIGVNWFVP